MTNKKLTPGESRQPHPARRFILIGGSAATLAALAPLQGATTRQGKTTANGKPLPGFEYRQIRTRGGLTINVATRGRGAPLLLLHGYPQNHRMWHEVAPVLAEKFAVVCADLRGYGDSSKPEGAPDHSNYSKRAMAVDMIEVMAALGHRRFMVAGHDRGARVAYRLALDHPEVVQRLALLDIVSTKAVYEGGLAMATRYFHWYFLIQPRPFPETLIGGDPAFYLRYVLAEGPMFSEYLRTFATPQGIHATCEDYRAGFAVDLPNDRIDVSAGRKITCPTLILWAAKGAVGEVFQPLQTWRELVESPTGEAIDSGHFIPEENPAETLRAFTAFFRA
jgi:haloacetate dehalogenase